MYNDEFIQTLFNIECSYSVMTKKQRIKLMESLALIEKENITLEEIFESCAKQENKK